MQNYWRVLLPVRGTRIGGGGGGGITKSKKIPKINPSNSQVIRPGQGGPCYPQDDDNGVDNDVLGPQEF